MINLAKVILLNKLNDSPSPVTMIEFITFRRGEPVQIPPHFVKELMKDVGERSALLLLKPNKLLYIILTVTEKIVQIVIYMSGFQSDLCSENLSVCETVLHFIEQEQLTIVHSSTLALTQSPCEYYLYLEPPSKEYSWKDFKQRLERNRVF